MTNIKTVYFDPFRIIFMETSITYV